MLAVVRGVPVEIHQLPGTAGIGAYFAGVEVARLVQRLEDDLLGGERAVVEGRLHRIEVVGSDGHQVATTTDVQMQFILKVQEADGEGSEHGLLVVDVVVHVNVAKNRANDVGTNLLASETENNNTFVSFSTNILMRSCLGWVR